MYVEVLTERRKQLGDDLKDTIGSINNLAHLYKQQGKYLTPRSCTSRRSKGSAGSWAMTTRAVPL